MSEKRWILVSDGTPQMWYLGKTDLTDENIDEHTILVLEECRAARTIMMPTQKGVSQNDFLAFHAFAKRPIRVRISARAWIWPDEDPDMLSEIEKLLEQEALAERVQRARDAGLSVPEDPQQTKDGFLTRIR